MEASITPSKKILTTLIFQLGWWANIGGARYDYLFASSLLSLFLICVYLFFVAQNFKHESIIILSVGSYGFILDSILNFFNIFNFIPNQNFIPIWLISIWLLFGMTSELYEYLDGKKLLSFILGAFFGPISYAAGLKLNLLTFPDQLTSLLVLAIIWGFNLIALLAFRSFVLKNSNQSL